MEFHEDGGCLVLEIVRRFRSISLALLKRVGYNLLIYSEKTIV